MLRKSDRSKPLSLNYYYSLTISFSLTICFFLLFFFHFIYFLILDSCLCELTLWPQPTPLVPTSSTLCAAEGTGYGKSQRSPTLGVKKQKIRDNPHHSRQTNYSSFCVGHTWPFLPDCYFRSQRETGRKDRIFLNATLVLCLSLYQVVNPTCTVLWPRIP